jgi:hypothetical protein
MNGERQGSEEYEDNGYDNRMAKEFVTLGKDGSERPPGS